MNVRRALALGVVCFGSSAVAQTAAIDADRGATGLWQKMLKLKTTASAMHTTAHPDDEHGGVLAQLSRGEGVRLSLLTLNRGESGDNAIGPELFDGVGLIRTEELLLADRYYGVDKQYFSTVIDYGFSKRLDEALDKWGKENVLRDVVRVIRTDRPLVLISRFQGNDRDGHGNHQTAGLITQEAFKVSGDANVFPEQIAQGLRPWQPLKAYIGGARENEEWHVRVDPGEYSPWLGDSYGNFARTGLAFQRSQNSGRLTLRSGPEPGFYKRIGVQSMGIAPKESGFFDGIDTSIKGLFQMLRKDAPNGSAEALAEIDQAVTAAFAAFRVDDPSASAPSLARGLLATRRILAIGGLDPDAAFILRAKEEQFQAAIHAALGVTLTAVAQPKDTQEPTGPFAAFASAPAMAPVVPGDSFEVKVTLASASRRAIQPVDVRGVFAPGVQSKSQAEAEPMKASGSLGEGRAWTVKMPLVIDPGAPLSRPYFSRNSIQEPRWALADVSQIHRPAALPVATVAARYRYQGADLEIRESVRRREANLPYGYELRELMILPRLAIRVTPEHAIAPLKAMVGRKLSIDVTVTHNGSDATTGTLALKLPAGWTSTPVSIPLSFLRAGESARHSFSVVPNGVKDSTYEIEAVASAAGRDYKEGYDVIEHRDLETRYLFRPATVTVRGVDVNLAPGLKVGYVMGVGDRVPEGLAQLGASVTLLDSAALATVNLSQFGVIMTGTRAYAVRDDLRTNHQRLMEYVRQGGNMIVLYNTQEFTPRTLAPFPADLPQRAEEVSEEDSPVTILAGDHPVFNTPNKITLKDFDGWVEQRGSKFFTEWDPAYVPLISTFDKGQAPQKGGWVTAKVGKGHYTYFAYALHRQLPYGVPGAYRVLANLLSLNRGTNTTPARAR